MNFSPLIIGTMRLGTWGAGFDAKQMDQFVEECLEMELVDFDLADIYGGYTSEAEFGAVLKRQPQIRDRLRLTTKCGIKLPAPARPEYTIKSYDSSVEHIKKSVEASLTHLNTDYLDLLLLHRPDYLMHPEEVAELFATLKKEGKVLHFGVSNFSASQVDLLHSYTPLVTNQLEISLLHRAAFDDGTLDQCIKSDITPTAWSPLGGGALFAKTTDYTSLIAVMQALSTKYEVEIPEIALAWLFKHPSGIIPVLGTSKTRRIKEAKNALNVNLTSEEWYALWQAATGHDIP